MKPYKTFLRIWIGIASVIGFLGGWALLAHSGKPVAFGAAVTTSTTSYNGSSIVVPTLPPLVTAQNKTTTNAQPVQIQMPSLQMSSSPLLVSRGS